MVRASLDPKRNFGFLLGSVYRSYVRLFERHSAELGLTLTQCRVLMFLYRNEGASQARVAGGVEADPMMMVRILDRMEQDAWIERRANPKDRRAYCLYLLEAATPVIKDIWRIADLTTAELFSNFDSDDRNRLIELLERAQKAAPPTNTSAGHWVQTPNT